MARLTHKHIPLSRNGYFSLPLPQFYDDEERSIPQRFIIEALRKTPTCWYTQLLEHQDNKQVQELLERINPEQLELLIDNHRQTAQLPKVFSEIEWDIQQNGFLRDFSVGRNLGSLQINNESIGEIIRYNRIPQKMLKEFKNKELETVVNKDSARIHTYELHNVDYFPAALFLREWGLHYINKCSRNALFE